MNNIKEPSSKNKELGSLFNIKTINISKSFGGTKALDDINLELMAGEIHGMVGQNGAGKNLRCLDHRGADQHAHRYPGWRPAASGPQIHRLGIARRQAIPFRRAFADQ
mgnify:CR=1 FL=1